MNDYLKKLVQHPLLRKSMIYTLTDAVNKAIPFLIMPFLTYYLSPADYGISSNYSIYIAVLLIFVGLNTNGALAANYFKFDKKQLSEYTFNVLLIIVASATIVSVVSFFFIDYISDSLSITTFFTFIGIWLACLQTVSTLNLDLWRMEEKPLRFGIYQIAQTAVNILFTVLLVIVYKMGWEGRILALVLTYGLFGCLSLIILYKRGYLKITVNREFLEDAVKFGLPLIPHSLGIWIRTGIDRVFITKLYGNEEVGLYSTGFQFGLLLSFIVLAFHNAFIPYLYRSLTDGGETVKLKLVKFTYLYFAGILVLAVLFSAAAELAIRYLLSSEYAGSGQFVLWAMFSQAFQGMYLMVSAYIFYRKRTAVLAIATFSISVLHVILSYCLIAKLGPIGGAYTSVVTSLLNFAIIWKLSSKVYPMPWFKTKID